MKILVSGCSFSSGWGVTRSWVDMLNNVSGYQVHNVSTTGASNQDIFLQTCKNMSMNSYDLVFVQFTALNRITVSPSPENEKIIVSYDNNFLQQALPGCSETMINNFVKVFTLLNQDWKHYFDLIDIIQFLQNKNNVFFINGLLPWDSNFFNCNWKIPMSKSNNFLESLLQMDEFDDNRLKVMLQKVIEHRDKIEKQRWLNLSDSWDRRKIDVVSNIDSHPGQQSQHDFTTQVIDFIKMLPEKL